MHTITSDYPMRNLEILHTTRVNYLISLATSLILILIAYTCWILMWPHRTIDASEPFQVLTPIVEAGTVLEYKSQYDVYTDKTFDVEFQLIQDGNPNLYMILPVRGLFHPGLGRHTYHREVPIPSDTQPGKYWLRIKDSVKFHPIRPNDTKWFRTEEFEVVKRLTP